MKLKSSEKRQTIMRRINLYKYYSYVNKILKVPLHDTVNWSEKGSVLDVITIAFNNTHVLKHQIAKIKKNLKDESFAYIIADNSDCIEKRNEIKELCRKEGVIYVGIPRPENNPFIIGSKSHAASLNWVYYQVVKRRSPRIFGFLDHDIYPLKPVSIANLMDGQILFGKKQTRGSYWYLWAGFCFFQLDSLNDISVDFSPSKVDGIYLDTGGALWYALYSKLNISDFGFPRDCEIPLTNLGYNYTEMVEFIGNDWFHSINASQWKESSDYSDAIDDILRKELIYFPEE